MDLNGRLEGLTGINSRQVKYNVLEYIFTPTNEVFNQDEQIVYARPQITPLSNSRIHFAATEVLGIPLSLKDM